MFCASSSFLPMMTTMMMMMMMMMLHISFEWFFREESVLRLEFERVVTLF